MSNKKKIIILGAGENSLDIIDTINDINLAFGRVKYECVGLLDDDQSNWGNVLLAIEVLGGLDAAPEYGECQFVSGIGSPSNFLKKDSILARTGLPLERYETIVYPTASVSQTAELSKVTVVFQNVTITST